MKKLLIILVLFVQSATLFAQEETATSNFKMEINYHQY